VNCHFGSKDELIVTRSLTLNRERLSELRAPPCSGCLGPDRQRSAAARFMIRVSIESVPPIRRRAR
jgi:hypothetical protein